MLALSAAFSLAALWVDRKLFITTPESMVRGTVCQMPRC